MFANLSFFNVRAAAQCYIDLIVKEADNNVKLIVLDRLIDLRDHPTQEKVLQVCSDPFHNNAKNLGSVKSICMNRPKTSDEW